MPISGRWLRPVKAVMLFVGLVSISACGGGGGLDLHPVSGSVTYDGKPAAGAQVTFMPEGQVDVNVISATGQTGEDGSFTLATSGQKGAPAGKYVVLITYPNPAKRPTAQQRMQGMNDSDAPDLLGGRYATREKSNLRAEIKPGDNKLEPFQVK